MGFFHIFSNAEIKSLDQVDSIGNFIAYIVQNTRELCNYFIDQRYGLLMFAVGMIVTLAVFLFARYVVGKVVLSRLAKYTKTDLDDKIITKTYAPAGLFIFIFGLCMSVGFIELPHALKAFFPKLLYAGTITSILWEIFRVISVLDDHFKKSALPSDIKLNELVIDLVRKTVKIAIWIVAVIFIAQNLFNLNVTALITGAGVAGLAVAFAAQNTIANIFGAITIISDKTFKIGQQVKIGDAAGAVESVGFRSTRLRSPDGTVWHIPNRSVADSTIENIALRPNVKYSFNLGLVYSTSPQKIQRALDILHEILDNHPLFDMAKQPPKVFFTDFKDSSLNLSVTVWFQSSDFWAMQEAKQTFNLAILEKFNAENIEFAFPTQTNYLINQENDKK